MVASKTQKTLVVSTNNQKMIGWGGLTEEQFMHKNLIALTDFELVKHVEALSIGTTDGALWVMKASHETK